MQLLRLRQRFREAQWSSAGSPWFPNYRCSSNSSTPWPKTFANVLFFVLHNWIHTSTTLTLWFCIKAQFLFNHLVTSSALLRLHLHYFKACRIRESHLLHLDPTVGVTFSTHGSKLDVPVRRNNNDVISWADVNLESLCCFSRAQCDLRPIICIGGSLAHNNKLHQWGNTADAINQ